MFRAKLLFHILPKAQIRPYPLHLANLATPHKLPHLPRQREKPRPDRLHEKQILPLRNIDQNLRLRGIDRKRLFAEHMLASFEGEARMLVVVGMRGGNVDDVDVWVGDEVRVGAVGGCSFRGAYFFEEGLGPRQGGGGGGSDDFVADVGGVASGGVD